MFFLYEIKIQIYTFLKFYFAQFFVRGLWWEEIS